MATIATFLHCLERGGLAAACLAVTVNLAFADSINGHWCSPENEKIAIQDDNVVTPGGTLIKGEFDRHHFVYTVPDSETHAGSTADLVLVDRDTIHLRYKSARGAQYDTAPQRWTRCSKPTS